MKDIQRRQATQADYDFLHDLHQQTFRLYVEQTWGWDDQQQVELFRQSHQNLDESPFEILCLEEKEIGCIAIEDKGDFLFLDYIAILPDYQNRGLGTQLIGELLELGKSRGIQVRLNVIKVNPARKLYERLGFQVVGSDEYRYYMTA